MASLVELVAWPSVEDSHGDLVQNQSSSEAPLVKGQDYNNQSILPFSSCKATKRHTHQHDRSLHSINGKIKYRTPKTHNYPHRVPARFLPLDIFATFSW